MEEVAPTLVREIQRRCTYRSLEQVIEYEDTVTFGQVEYSISMSMTNEKGEKGVRRIPIHACNADDDAIHLHT